MARCLCACGNVIPTQPWRSTRVTRVETCYKCNPGFRLNEFLVRREVLIERTVDKMEALKERRRVRVSVEVHILAREELKK